MKIIALLPEGSGYLPGAVVSLTGYELARIVGGDRHGTTDLHKRIKIGAEVEVNGRFDHAQDVLKAAHEAKKLPQALRAFADTLETLHPAINEVTDPVIDASFEVTQ